MLLHNCAISIYSYSPVNKFYNFKIFSFRINAVILPLNCPFSILYLLHTFSFSQTLFSQLKHYLDLYITDTALKVTRSLYLFTTSISHGVENYSLRLWGTGISDAVFYIFFATVNHSIICR